MTLPRAFSTWRRYLLLPAVAAAAMNLAAAHATIWNVDSQTTINAALASALPGDTIVVKDGVYNFPLRINGNHGTAANPIVFRSETLGGVTFTGNSLGDNAKLRLERNYWHIDGFNFQDIKIPGTASSDRLTVIRLRGASHNVLSNLTIQDSGLSAASPHSNASNNTMFLHLTLGSTNNVVERSQFLNNSKSIVVRVGGGSADPDNTDNLFRYNYWTGHAGFETLQLSWGGASDNIPYRTTVEHNLWQGNASSSELVSVKSAENTFRHNTFDHNNDQLVLRSGHNNVVDSNYFLNGRGVRAYGSGQEITNNYFEGFFGPDSGNLKGGILLGAGTASDVPYAPFRQSVVANNTIVNTGDTSLLYGQFYGSNVSGSFIGITPYANEFKDNLIVNSAGQAIRRENNAPDVDNLWSGNVVWPTASGAAGYTPSGVIVSNPALQRDAAGMLVSTMWPNAGASIPYRPLTIWDVGPGSSYIAGLPGDFNRDGVVDGTDLLLMQQHLGPTTFATAVFDGNGDGMVNGADFDTWRMQFGQSLPGLATMGVPEPGSLAASCLALAIVAASARGRRIGRRAR